MAEEKDDFAVAFDEAVNEEVPAVAAPAPVVDAAPAVAGKDEFDTPAPVAEPAAVVAAPAAAVDPAKAAEPVVAPAAVVAEPAKEPAAVVAAPAVVDPAKPVEPVVAPVVAAEPVKVAPVVVAPAAPAKVDPPVAAVEEPKFDAPFTMSDDDKAAVAEVQKEWPDVQKGVSVLLRQQAHALEQKFAGAMYQVIKAIDARMAPVAEAFTESAQEKHLNAIATANGADWREALLPKVEDWVKTLPTKMQATANETLDKGSTQDVNELFAQYKKVSGIAPAPAVAAAPVVVAAPAAAPDPAVAAAAAALAPVKSGRAAPQPGAGVVDKNDYAGAFAEATANDK